MFNLYIPTKVLFGCGQLNNLHKQTMPGKKALIVVSNGKSVKVNGYLSRTEEQLHQAGAETFLFDKIEANPLHTTVTAGGHYAAQVRADFLVALGGGSVLDAAKGIAVVAANGGDVWDYVTNGTGKGKAIAAKPLPILAIPTTAGTGSETDMGGVITNRETREKTPIKDLSLFPQVAVIDPELMLTVPPRFTAYQGFDALFHNIEGYIANKASDMSEMIALTAIEHLAAYLPRAVADGTDLEAREKVAFASYLGGVEMVVCSTVSEHSLEHSLSAFHQELPHGAGLIMLSEAYFTYFIEHHACDERFVRLAKALGKVDAAVPTDFISALKTLQQACGVAELKMSDYGIVPDEFPEMARIAKSAMAFLFASDRIPLSEADVVEIYENAYR